MRNKLIVIAVFLGSITICTAQNFSGLQYKRLTKLDDVGFMVEKGIGALFGAGKIAGNLDSVVVSWDAERVLKLKIYYTGFENAFFTISAMDGAKKQQNDISFARFPQAGSRVPVEAVLNLDPKVPKGTKMESPLLRIDIAKDFNKLGKVYAYSLNKNWKTDLDKQNVIVDVTLQPVGKASLLTGEVRDAVPDKTIKFDPTLRYTPIHRLRVKSTGNSFTTFDYTNPEDISGTWTNTDPNTKGITKLIITGNNSIQGFGKCSPEDCDWGKTALSGSGDNYKAVFSWSFKITTLTINYEGGQLNVNESDVFTSNHSTATYSYSFKKNASILFTRTNIHTLSEASNLSKIQGITAVSTNPAGPNKDFQFSLIDGFSADVDFKRPQDISSINLNGFMDKNTASGIVYILPADYHLKWEAKPEPEKGYDFRILYGAQSTTATETTDAPVRMSATLTAGVSTREINFIRTLLKASIKTFKNVKFLPLRENPQFTFQNTLGAQYNIPQNKISVETSTDLNNDIRVAWQTDADTKEFIQTAMTSGEGVAASVVLKPDNDDILDQLIPAAINIADTRTLGKMNIEPNLWRTRNWRNTTPYPLKLNYLHVLKKENNGTNPIIYSWSMNDAVIPSQGQAAFNNSVVPRWLDNAESVVMWLDYSVMDCPECDKQVMDAVTGGVSGSKSQQVKFTIPPAVFDTLNTSYFMISIRSTQVDPKGGDLKELDAIKIMKETGEATAGPLFTPTGGSLEFEYKITAASADGDFFPMEKWIKATGKDVLLGKTKMKELFKGIIPGIN